MADHNWVIGKMRSLESLERIREVLQENYPPCPRCGDRGLCTSCRFSGVDAPVVVLEYWHQRIMAPRVLL